MNRDCCARELLRRAATLYDGDDELREAARNAWRRGFASGARWMALALARCRGVATPEIDLRQFHRLGMIKYALAGSAMMIALIAGVALRSPWPITAAPVAFYLVEVQMLFLFPLALDGSPTPFRDSFDCTRRAGGTLVAMRRVTVLAAVMLFGGLAGRGFVRCWCLGCLAVCIWYEQLARPGKAAAS
jgi:hypothetical protein